ncbi:hypothetical protein [Candidatus Nanohalobium constans]|uniref:Lipoprotein n=1 Tax=Candidatus Nanohalobium constans TaxID=2565781 RepID=A0A5Q0UGQ8_9ARCH|nr:hypothetical protein [Candidatus Nanohalobium constans]QGA80797.1 hypothetical protein LC1Nh_0915 [Candidatus Nanohalobium constans]
MDNKIILTAILALAASGCMDSTNPGGGSGNGIQVEKFSITDDTLNPNQKTVIEAKIRNYNKAPTTLNSENITLFNTGQLKVQEDSKNCNPKKISNSDQDINPVIRCTWNVEAPGKSFIEGFDSKPLSVKLQIRYSSTVENNQPLKINFQNMSEIKESSPIKTTASNNDLKMSIETQTPSPVTTPETLTVKTANTGVGSIKGKIKIKCSPEKLFSECPQEKTPIQDQTRFNLNAETELTGTQNIFISTHYKYEKNPNLDIEVVNN